MQQTFVLHTQKNTSFVLNTQKTRYCTAYSKKHSKSRQKRRQKSSKKRQQKSWQKHCHLHNTHANHQKKTSQSIFLNLSCCCLETGLKPVMFIMKFNQSCCFRVLYFEILLKQFFNLRDYSPYFNP